MEIDHGIDNKIIKAIKDGAHIAPRLCSHFFLLLRSPIDLGGDYISDLMIVAAKLLWQ